MVEAEVEVDGLSAEGLDEDLPADLGGEAEEATLSLVDYEGWGFSEG